MGFHEPSSSSWSSGAGALLGKGAIETSLPFSISRPPESPRDEVVLAVHK